MDSVDTAAVDAAPAVTPQILGGEAQKLGTVKEQYRSPLSGAVLTPGRVKGVPNKVTRTIKEAVELACQPGACHPKGLAGWLVERAKSRSAADRQIFAGLVGKALPLQVNAHHSGGIAIQLGWLQGRGIGATQAPEAITLEATEIDGQVVLAPAEDGGTPG